MSLVTLPTAARVNAFVASAGIQRLTQFQAGLLAIESSIEKRLPTSDIWPSLVELVQQGLEAPTVRPFLDYYHLPVLAGAPTTEHLASMAQEVRALVTPGPIRRKDPIAQNSFHWAQRAAIYQGRKRVTYKTLDARADAIATFLTRAIHQPGQRVAIFFSKNRPNVFEIVLGARRAGAQFTNFHAYLSGEAFVEYALANPYRILFLDSESLLKVEPLLPILEDQNRVVIDIDSLHPEALAYGQLLVETQRPAASTPDEKPPRYPGPVMYSSGTTGHPKLISVRATAHSGSQANKLFGITEHDRNLVVGQLYHGGAYSWAKGHLNRGAEVTLLETSGLTLHPEETLETIEKRKITNFWISPPWLQGLCMYLESPPRPFDLSSVRAIFVGAAPFHPVLKRLAVDKFGPILWENYATTEFGLVSTLSPKDLLTHPTTVGRAAPGVDIQIRDSEGREVTRGEPGRIFVRNALTEEEFDASDDLGKIDEEGYLTVLGRTIEQIVCGGETIYPRAFENELMEMKEVHECHMIGIPDPILGEAPVLAVVPRSGGKEIGPAEIIDFLTRRGALEPLNGRPLRVVIVPSLPRKPYKVNNQMLREMILRHGKR